MPGCSPRSQEPPRIGMPLMDGRVLKPEEWEYPLPDGTVLDRNDPFIRNWPGRARFVKVESGAVFKLPPEYCVFWIDPYERMWEQPKSLDDLKVTAGFDFVFMWPNRGGLTPKNYTQFDTTMFPLSPPSDKYVLVSVRSVPSETFLPGGVGGYGPNMRARLMGANNLAPIERVVGVTPMQCLAVRPDDPDPQWSCFGRVDEYPERLVEIRFKEKVVEPWRYAVLESHYALPVMGGLEVEWRTFSTHLNDWKAIDQQVWNYINQWLVRDAK